MMMDNEHLPSLLSKGFALRVIIFALIIEDKRNNNSVKGTLSCTY